jgi:hypothetical protein
MAARISAGDRSRKSSAVTSMASNSSREEQAVKEVDPDR